MAWLRTLVHGYTSAFFLLLAGSALQAGVTIGYALIIRQVINAAARDNLDGTKIWLLALAALVTVQLLLRAGCRYLEERTYARIEAVLRVRMFAALLRSRYPSVNAVHTGEWLSRIAADGKVVTDGVVSLIPNAISLAFRLLLAFIVLVWFDWTFAPVLLAAAVLFVLLTFMMRGKLKRLHGKVQQKDADMRSFLQERMGGLVVIKAFNARPLTLEQAKKSGTGWYLARLRQRVASVLASAGMTFLYNSGYVYTLARCSRNLLNHAMDFGTVSLVLQLIVQIQAPLSAISGLLPQYYSLITSAQRLMEIEQLPQEPPALPDDVLARHLQGASAVSLQGVSFAYDEDTPVLQQTDCTVALGKFTVLTGASGIGKSTLFALLLGILEPQQGCVLLQTKDGHLPLDATTRALFAYVPQGNGLFSGSVRDNLKFAAPDASEQQIQQALQTCCAKEFVDALPDGLDTVLGENGSGLSEGQAQRIALARAVLSAAPILLLDESTGALDAETERKVLRNLRGLTERTVLLISHREAALELCDVHLHLQDGKMV